MSGPPARSRLVLRIYVVMLLAIAGVVAVLIFGRPRPQPPAFFGPGPSLDYLVQTIAQQRNDRSELRAALEKAKHEHHLDITIYDAAGALLGSSAPEPPPPATADEIEWARRGAERGLRHPPGPPHGRPSEHKGPPPGARPFLSLGLRHGPADAHHDGPGRVVVPLSPEGEHAIVQFERHGPVAPDFRFDIVIVLLCLGVASWVLARMIARPLQQIASAAQAFGSGDLQARSRLARHDELGQLSVTFDEMAERITQLLRAQRELLASVSHELRTPLSRIRVALDLAAEGDAASAHQSLRDITEDLGELEELVNDVLAMARLETQSTGPRAIPRLHTTAVNARAIAEKAAARFAGTHAGRTLDLQLSDVPVMIEADPNLLRRVIENLLDNAHKYSETSSPITLSLTTAEGQAVFTVVDRGEGIAGEDLPFVFDPFFRVDRSRTRGTGGVGLGLALSKRIVEAHGGRIDIESRPGMGTTVTFTVPRAAG